MIKYENNFWVLILLLLPINQIHSQSLNKLGFGVNLYILETNIQENIFSEKEDISSFEFSFGFEGVISKRILRNTRIEIGLDYSYFQFTQFGMLEVSYGERDLNNQFNLTINDSNPIADFESNTIIFWDDSSCREGESLDSDRIEVGRSYHNRFQTIGLPIRFEYLLGKKPVKIYFSGGVSPELYLSKELDLSPKKTRGGVGTTLCGSNEIGVGYTERYKLISHTARVEKYNMRAISLSTELGVGIVHKAEKNLFKIGIHYGGNTINFSKIGDTNFIRETIKFKFGLHKIAN